MDDMIASVREWRGNMDDMVLLFLLLLLLKYCSGEQNVECLL